MARPVTPYSSDAGRDGFNVGAAASLIRMFSWDGRIVPSSV
jgi:hypothetical protein